MKSKLLVIVTVLAGGTVVGVGCGGASESGGGGSGADASTGDASPITTDSGGSSSGDSGGKTDSGSPDAAKDADAGPQVTIQYGNCATFAPCGGDPTGSFKLTGGCVEPGIFNAAKQGCAGLQESNVTLKASGTLNIAGGSFQSSTTLTIGASVFVPQSCLDAAPTPFPITCALLGPLLTTQQAGGFDKATCVSAGANAGCNCNVEKSTTQTGTDTYTTAGNTLTTGGGDTYDYCAQSPKLSWVKTGAEPVPAVFEFSK